MPYHQESALGNSLAQQAGGQNQPFSQQIPFMQNEIEPPFPQTMASQPFDIPRPSTSYVPSREAPMSPPTHLSTLDAPLPASFDSQGISYIARHGPVAASVPSKFGQSPPASFSLKSTVPAGTLRNLHESAFGSSLNKSVAFGASPSASHETGPRIMHSQRVSKPKLKSASLPRASILDEWENDDHDLLLFGGEDEYIPSTMAHLYSAAERERRVSGKIDDPHAIRESLVATGAEFSNKMASPSNASPSRFTGFFNKQKLDDGLAGATSSSFGQLGSPLRNSSLHFGTSPGVRNVSRTASSDMAFKVSSPPQHSSVSGIAQALQRTRLSGTDTSNNESLRPIPTGRHPSNPRAGVDRAVSSSSVSTSRIDEEQPDFVFDLDEDLGAARQPSGSPWNQMPAKAPAAGLGPIGGGRRSLEAKETNGMRVPAKKGF